MKKGENRIQQINHRRSRMEMGQEQRNNCLKKLDTETITEQIKIRQLKRKWKQREQNTKRQEDEKAGKKRKAEQNKTINSQPQRIIKIFGRNNENKCGQSFTFGTWNIRKLTGNETVF